MKVAIVLNTSWNIYNFRMGLIKSMLEKGIEVYAIAPKDEYTQYLVDVGCHYKRVRMDSRGANPFKDFALIIELFSIYRKIKPDLILHFTIKPNIYGTLAANMLKIPVINNVCGLGTVFLKNNLVSKVAIALYKLAFRFPKKIFFQNDEDQQLFVERNMVDPNITDILPGSGIDFERFKSKQPQAKGNFTFLLISRLITDKGILEYIDAVKKLKTKGLKAKFQLLGPKDPAHKRGIPVSIIDSWLKDGAVEYLGTTEDVREFIDRSDCVVLPSYREGTPRTLLEAASMGKPIVATNVPGCTNVVKDHFNGLLCKAKDSSDLADKMQQMYSLNDSVRQEMGKNSRKLIEQRFDEQMVINKYLQNIDLIQKN